MKRNNWRQIIYGISLMLVIYFCMPAFLVLAQDPKTGQASSQTEQPIAGKAASTQAAKERGPERGISASFFGSAQKASVVLKRIGGILSGERTDTGQWSDAVAKLSGGKGSAYLVGTVGVWC